MTDQRTISNTWSGVWAKPKGVNLHGRLFSEAYPVVKKYFSQGSYNILEIGTGSGRYGNCLAKDFPQSHFTLTDVTEESLAVAKKLSVQLGVSNVTFAQADILNLPFQENEFDVVFCDGTLQVFESEKDHERSFQSMLKVLKPGGKLIVAVPNYWSPHTLFKWMKGEGYEYGFEKSFKGKELMHLAGVSHLEVLAMDGFSVSYGFYRQKAKLMKIIGKGTDILVKTLDFFSGRYISKHFGFEIFLVAKKR